MTDPDMLEGWGLSPEDEAELAADIRRYDREMRRAAIRMLWGRPIKARARDPRMGWTIYDGHERNRSEEWTLWRAIVATVALVLDRRHRQIDVERHHARTGRLYIDHVDMGFWDGRSDGYGYSFAYLNLYAGWRVEVSTDGESSL